MSGIQSLRGLRDTENRLVVGDICDVMRSFHGGVWNAAIVRGPNPAFHVHGQGMTRPTHCERKAPPFPGYRKTWP